MDDLRTASGEPFFTNITKINDWVSVGMMSDSPAVLVMQQFIRLTAPEAKLLADKIKELAA